MACGLTRKMQLSRASLHTAKPAFYSNTTCVLAKIHGPRVSE
jgi:hypothetical protein